MSGKSSSKRINMDDLVNSLPSIKNIKMDTLIQKDAKTRVYIIGSLILIENNGYTASTYARFFNKITSIYQQALYKIFNLNYKFPIGINSLAIDFENFQGTLKKLDNSKSLPSEYNNLYYEYNENHYDYYKVVILDHNDNLMIILRKMNWNDTTGYIKFGHKGFTLDGETIFSYYEHSYLSDILDNYEIKFTFDEDMIVELKEEIKEFENIHITNFTYSSTTAVKSLERVDMINNGRKWFISGYEKKSYDKNGSLKGIDISYNDDNKELSLSYEDKDLKVGPFLFFSADTYEDEDEDEDEENNYEESNYEEFDFEEYRNEEEENKRKYMMEDGR